MISSFEKTRELKSNKNSGDTFQTNELELKLRNLLALTLMFFKFFT